jgi:AcrR family transcriptional regulator
VRNPEGAVPPPPGLRARKKRQTRSQLLAAARHLFSEKGYNATTVDEIAAAAEVSRGTLFNYFPEKAALLTALGDSMADGLMALLERERARPASVAEQLASVFADSAAAVEGTRDLSRTLILATLAGHDLAERRVRMRRLHGGVAALLEPGVRRREVRSDLPLSLLAEMVAGTYTEILLTWLAEEGYPLAERMAQAASLLAELLAPGPQPNGHRPPSRA